MKFLYTILASKETLLQPLPLSVMKKISPKLRSKKSYPLMPFFWSVFEIRGKLLAFHCHIPCNLLDWRHSLSFQTQARSCSWILITHSCKILEIFTFSQQPNLFLYTGKACFPFALKKTLWKKLVLFWTYFTQVRWKVWCHSDCCITNDSP